MKKLLSLLLILALALVFASCEKSESTPDSDEPISFPEEISETVLSDDNEKTEPVTSEAEEETTTTAEEDEEVELLFKDIVKFNYDKVDPDPSKWTTEEIVACYKSGMAMEDHDDVQTDQSFELAEDMTGKASILNGPVKLAMKLAAQPYGALTGGYWDLTADDLKGATAKKDGDYIVITLYPKNQTDGPNGNEHEGTVGHVLNVVQGIDDFIAYVEENFSILNAKYDDDSVVLKYSEAYGTVRINTKTGKMETGKWGYTVDVYLDHCSMAGIQFEDFHTKIRWKCWYPVVD